MSFQIVTDATQDNIILGVGPFPEGTDFGPDYPIFTIDDDAQYAWVIDNFTANYYCPNTQSLQLDPCSA